MKKILVLYREVAGYFLDCLNHLCAISQMEADVVAYPGNSEAPFQFETTPRIRIINRGQLSKHDLVAMVSSDSYDLIFCGGWFDKEYNQALKHRKCASVLGFDNHRTDSLRQWIQAMAGRFLIKPSFDFAFVPATPQKELALLLGFHPSKIKTGAYACNVENFSTIQIDHSSTSSSRKKRLIYTGRYAKEKFSHQLFKSFAQLPSQIIEEWELHAYGTGIEWEQRPMHPAIIHHGFVQPNKLKEEMTKGHAFVLPSIFEPWGVVVHEFAAAGFPMLLSNSVGAAEAFLEENKNGFLFDSGDSEKLKEGLIKLLSCSNVQLQQMGVQSKRLAQKITPETWSQTLLQIAQQSLH